MLHPRLDTLTDPLALALLGLIAFLFVPACGSGVTPRSDLNLDTWTGGTSGTKPGSPTSSAGDANAPAGESPAKVIQPKPMRQKGKGR